MVSIMNVIMKVMMQHGHHIREIINVIMVS